MKAVVGHVVRRQVAFVGPLGVGKTTAVRTISDTPVVNTEVVRATANVKDRATLGKRTTTVGIDYGEWNSSDYGRVGVYGTPGQNRFGVARGSAIRRNVQLVLWTYGQNDYALEELDEWLRFLILEPSVARTLTVVVTRLDMAEEGAPAIEAYREVLENRGQGIQLAVGDPRDRGSVIDVVTTALRAAR